MVFDILARDGASGSFRRIGREAEVAGGKVAGFEARMNKVGKAAFGISVAFAAFAVNAAVKFESAMTRISTQAGVPIKDINALSTAILGLSPKVGFNPDELATSLYHVESAFRTTGITAGKAIGIVENASKLAKIGNADLETTTQAIIGVLASNIKGVKDAQDAAAQLNQLVGTGDTNLQTVAKSIATGILPTAATLGLSFKDVAAGLATLTDNVTPADQAARVLKTSLLTLIKPSAQQAAAFEQLGLGTLQLGEDFHKPNGLLVGVQDLKTHLDAVFPATQKTALTTDQLDKAQQSYYQTLVAGGTNAKDATKESEKYRHSIENVSVATLRANTVARALGGSKTAGTFLTLIQEIDRLKSKYDDFGTSAQAASKFQEAWANQQKTAKQKLDELKASWDVFLVQVGNAILPDLKKVVDVLAKHPGIIKAAAGAVGLLAAAWVASKFASAFSIIGRLTAAILGIGTAATTAATETAAANLGGGVAAAEGAGAAGLAGRGARGAAAAEGAGAGAAAAGEGGIIARLLTGGVSLGPIAVGIAGIAGGIHEIITDGQVKNLPALDQLTKLIAGPGPGSGLKGVGPAEAVGLALSTAKTGNNRNEDIQSYLTRTLSSDVAGKNGLSYQKFFKIIQTGTQDQLTAFIAAYRSVEFQLKGSPNTIDKVDTYLQALFSRYNSARVAVDGYTKKQMQAKRDAFALAVAQKYLSTNVADVAKTYGVGAVQAQKIADANKFLQYDISSTVTAMKGYGVTLDKNTYAGKQNINQVEVLAVGLKQQHDAVLKLTGSQSIANETLRVEATNFEQAAVKAGFNKGQVDTLIKSLGLLPPDPTSTVHVNGIGEATQEVAVFAQQLRNLAQPIIVPIVAQAGLTGVASSNYLPNIGQIATAQGGLNFGGSGPGGIAGGVGHAMGGIAKGWSWVGERGKELIHVGSPSRVLTHEESMAAAGGSGPLLHVEHQTINNNVDAREVAQQVGASVRMALTAKGV